MQNNITSPYEDRMLEAFIASSENMPFYRDLYDRATCFGEPRLCWKWSWYALLGGALFPLYRKAYLGALIIFGATLFFLMLAIVFADDWGRGVEFNIKCVNYIVQLGVSWTGASGFAPYFIIKRYCDLKAAIEAKYANEDDRVAIMARHGGVHQWVEKLGIAIVRIGGALLLLGLLINYA
ncbi:MAG: hypothetical protein LBO72_03575 [Helicobacteraceae bacterium]|jgi:hypothetical protein|nr:hypothetical protein [Helicobacteraceae bacterium]